jgi:hypothetical protein
VEANAANDSAAAAMAVLTKDIRGTPKLTSGRSWPWL